MRRCLAPAVLSVTLLGCGGERVVQGEWGEVQEVLYDSLPELVGTIALKLGGEDGEPGFVAPSPLGADADGRYYVIDPALQEVHRFGPDGTYEGIFVRSGQGPGEIRMRPSSFGSSPDGLWYSEFQTGRIHFVPFFDSVATVRESEWTYLRLGAGRADLVPASGWAGREFILRADFYDRMSPDPLMDVSVRWYRADAAALDTVIEYVASSPTVRLDRGQTVVRIPLARFDPMAVYRPIEHSLILVEQTPSTDGQGVRIKITVVDGKGALLRGRELRAPARTFQPADRQRALEELLRRASFEGARAVSEEVEAGLRQLVEEWPMVLPEFEALAPGPNGTTWLQRTASRLEESRRREWLVLDSLLLPVARATAPAEVGPVQFLQGGDWWATTDAGGEDSHVVKVVFSPRR